ncbi:MAG TPA: Uma2 family endonuclease [Verrucomicrobiota bacterium]|nr:Uma2 family endonuclease [Verrucomicrobiota bacterium]
MNTVPVLSLEEIQEDRPMPSRNQSRAAQNLAVALAPYRDRFEAFHQLSLNLDGWESIPDLCLYPAGILPRDWADDEDVVTRPPALVIEILSPKQNLQPLLDKVRTYHSHGAKSCWVVVPGTETVSVFPANGGSRSFSEGDVVDAVLDLRVPFAAVFA